VYVGEAKGMMSIRAELHRNIQDCFNEAGVEILSPHYTAIRDGNETSIPGIYSQEARKAKSFDISFHRDPLRQAGELDGDQRRVGMD
jgi:small-conductance mechanosensitive channel